MAKNIFTRQVWPALLTLISLRVKKLGAWMVRLGWGLGILIFLSGCNSKFIGSFESKILAENAFSLSNGPLPDTDEQDTSDVPSFNYCSNNGSRNAGTNVIRADGVSVSLYKAADKKAVASSTNLAITLNSAGQTEKFRADLINERKLKINVSGLNDGIYGVILCDSTLSPDGSCGTTESPDKKKNKIGSYESNYFVNVQGGRVVAGGEYKQAEKMTGIAAINVLYDINVKSSEPLPDGDQEVCDKRASPLMIDFAETGIDLSKPLDGVAFDIRGSGVKYLISWPKTSSSAFLVLDRNGNGLIESVHEMFGNNTRGPDGKTAANGFEALRKYDSNGDGKIGSEDAAFTSLRIWGDSNRNGISEKGELKSLSSSGIDSISLKYVEKFEEDNYGNATIQRSVTHMSDGTARKMVDVWFRPIPIR